MQLQRKEGIRIQQYRRKHAEHIIRRGRRRGTGENGEKKGKKSEMKPRNNWCAYGEKRHKGVVCHC